MPSPLALSCLGCHPTGLGPAARAVDLRTLDAQVLSTALREFRSGERSGTVMPRLARGLSDDEIVSLARAFAPP